MIEAVKEYNHQFETDIAAICDVLAELINDELKEAENKIWHGHPVWFLDGNPIVGYSLQTAGVRLMFWSGEDFEEEKLNKRGVKFKDASIFYNSMDEIQVDDVRRWLGKSRHIQWDYKNLVKRKGELLRKHSNI